MYNKKLIYIRLKVYNIFNYNNIHNNIYIIKKWQKIVIYYFVSLKEY